MTTKAQSTIETLEPCPNPECQSTKAVASNDFANYYVYCADCFLRGPRESVDHYGARWNALPRISPASTAPVVDDNNLFNAWFATNHPFDWWAKERSGEPLAHRDRLLVTELLRRAFYRETKVS